jgi:hypothetical protein
VSYCRRCRRHGKCRKRRECRKWRECRECRRCSRCRRRRMRRRRAIVTSRPNMAQGFELFCGLLHLCRILNLVLWLYRRNISRGSWGIRRSGGATLRPVFEAISSRSMKIRVWIPSST